MDDADRAQIELEREEERMRAQIAVARENRWAVACVECGDDLLPVRREYGLCIDCAREREMRAVVMA